MPSRMFRILCVSSLLTAALAPVSSAEELIIKDSAPPLVVEDILEDEYKLWAETEALLETEAVSEIPPGITQGLKKDTPTGEAAAMTPDERGAFLSKVYEANSAQRLWKRHENISSVYYLFDGEAQKMAEYSVLYTEPGLYYSDDWSPGLEELRLLIRGEDDCVEDYTQSIRFIRFLNASGNAYRSPETAPVTLDEDTKEETLLSVLQTDYALFVITQLAESSIWSFDLEEPAEDAFYSCTYLLDPATLEVQMTRISLHDPSDKDWPVMDVREIIYSYDRGMTPFVETGFKRLLRHMDPEEVWDIENLRTVTLIRDPGAKDRRKYSLTALKGDPVSITLPPGYEIYRDETLTTRWIDDGDYTSDLTLWAAPDGQQPSQDLPQDTSDGQQPSQDLPQDTSDGQ